ncbi:putative ABC transporter [Aggregatibacter actinomycetemcomitans serotype e str. SC1083]|uniref:Putative ABC transporter n=2 Tax=Aggregatibacter actinomycetemcomitans TaxID=714 RepID=G4A7A7_AGGAC|nr:DUF805 domain-containing protein [Aggregatibacter actinomycetemcomitans]EGY34311.1 putative ABC transporter [Aggregatibacter actinomycetemcomitans serotype e str. SC1083]KYK72648.1 aminopeptidase [Aggregatibacter actinomycetemcomitans serotype e str. SA3096]KYK78550.1 aminopeptidase [Aggregatibacter actinomycetemcomitans serotype e str. SC936]TYB22246.1 DUF805 domain-containing protein [Aggregatibacter actinomycetemcomitans]
MNWYLHVLKNYATFSGRARRKEYWMFVLFNFIATFVCMLIDAVIQMPIFQFVYGFGVIIPYIAVTVRRLHDTDRSGWWILISFIPLVGSIVLLVFMCFDSQPGTNRFGDNPKENAVSNEVSEKSRLIS